MTGAQQDLHAAARAYAARGWPVFPCHPNDKRPLTEHGFEDASTDAAVIDAWWRRWPDAMIGVPMGAPIGAFVVDIDVAAGEPAAAVLARLAAAAQTDHFNGAPATRTPRGGLHLWFAMPAGMDVGNRANLLRAGKGESKIDVRGTGGYVVVPPSRRRGPRAGQEGCDGGTYYWDPPGGPLQRAPPPAPPGLLDLVLERHGAKDAPPAPAPAPPLPADDRGRRYALSALEAETRAVATCPAGGRNDALNRAAYSLGQLVGAGALTEAVVLAALEQAAADCGLVKDDGVRAVRKTIRSGLDGGRSSPRDLADVGRRAARPPPAPPMPDTFAVRPAAPGGGGGRGSRGSGPAPREGGGAGGGGGGEPLAGGDAGEPPDEGAILAANAAEPQNDTGNGRRLMRWHGRDMLIVRDVGPHVWAGTHWEAHGGDEAFQRNAQATAALIAEEAGAIEPSRRDREAMEAAESPEADKEVARTGMVARDRLAKRRADRRRFAISSGNTNRINGMIAQAAPHMTVPPEAMDADPLVINVGNGTLRLAKEPDPECPDPDAVRMRWTVRLAPHDRGDRIAKVMPVDYDPEAAAPKWTAFIERFQPHEPIRRFLRAYHGYALTGLMGEQVFVFNYGLGANGKSTFMEALARLMGNYAQVLPAEALTGDVQRRGDQATPEFARLPGARLVRCAELPRGQGFRESTIKMLTGGEPLLVRHLHARFFELRPTFKAIGSGNDRPNVGGVDEGIWRRMKLVPWDVTIAAAERRPMEKVLAEFAAERTGILNWLLDGLLDYLDNGLVVPPEIQAATESYRADMDPVGEFTRVCVAPAPGQDVTARDMFTAYVAWCHANSVRPFAEKTFAVIMVQKGFDKESGRIRKYKNVVLQDVPPDPNDQARYSQER